MTLRDFAKARGLRMENGGIPFEEVNRYLVEHGEAPVPTDMTPAEALAMLIEETGLSRAELERITGRRFRVPEDGEVTP